MTIHDADWLDEIGFYSHSLFQLLYTAFVSEIFIRPGTFGAIAQIGHL